MALKTKNIVQTRKNVESSGNPLVIADNLGIKYEGEKEKSGDFKSLVHGYLSLRQKENNFEDVWALRGISFTGYPGDVLGVIGFNGAGKTTLCRAILGMLKPDLGTMQVNGEVSSLLSLGTGFNQEISGRENIILNGLVLGLSRAELEDVLPEIEEFSGLGRFLRYPLKYYSTGMRARLGFSIAVAMDPEILVVDEVLSTGDLEFRDRAVKRMHELVSGAKMVVVVTQDPSFIEESCTKGLWLNKGKIEAFGHPGEVAEGYREAVANKAGKGKKLVNIRETRTEVGEEETIRAENLGIKFELDGDPFWALQNVNFSAHEREILGIIGPNGAGKSTLCRTLCGLYRPDYGEVQIKGEVTALLTFSLGFNAQLTGYDNIYLNGMMLGMSRKEIEKVENDIIEFAELEDKIHKPVKEYSSGMKSRLGFSIASMLQPDVFVVDEALSAGDMAFKEKATARMQEMLETAKTVVLVTHSLNIVEKVCTRAIWLKEGTVQFDGDPSEAVRRYKNSVRRYSRMKKSLPVQRDIRIKQAVEKFGAGEYKMAEDLLAEVLVDYPRDVDIWKQYAEIAYSLRNWEESKTRWEYVIRLAQEEERRIPRRAKRRLRKLEERINAEKGL